MKNNILIIVLLGFSCLVACKKKSSESPKPAEPVVTPATPAPVVVEKPKVK